MNVLINKTFISGRTGSGCLCYFYINQCALESLKLSHIVTAARNLRGTVGGPQTVISRVICEHKLILGGQKQSCICYLFLISTIDTILGQLESRKHMLRSLLEVNTSIFEMMIIKLIALMRFGTDRTLRSYWSHPYLKPIRVEYWNKTHILR